MAIGSGAAVAAQPGPRFDLIIRHGTVIDGTGIARYRADVAIANGFIARVGDLSKERAAEEIDATGLFVAPGFINIHSHASVDALPTAENMLTQGVTTEIVNPDGGGSIDLPQQLARASSAGLAVNVGAFIGFNAVWTQVMGNGDRRASTEEIERMRTLIVKGLEAGAWGVSAGLDYKPAYYAQVEEVIRIVEPAARWRTNFPNHDRLTPEANYSSKVGVAETIAIGEKAGVVPVVTHMKSQGLEQGNAGGLLAMMQDATKRGHYTAADAYPYLAGQTGLGALMIPAWAQEGGRDRMLERFKDPAQRARIAAETEQAMKARFSGPEGVFLPALSSVEGPPTKRQLVDVMREQQTTAGETVLRLLEQGNVSAILKFGSEEDLVKILQHPTTSIACDCGASVDTRQHPRAWGTFPRVLGHYVRETKALTWEDAIRKMTALPAATVGLIDRGYLAAGMVADVAIFDPASVIDRATYEDAGRLSEGIREVLVNGRRALHNGKTTGAQAGRVLLRTPHMPSRPMSTGSRVLTLAGKVRPASPTSVESSDAQLAIDVSQAARDRRAAGKFRLTSGGQTLEAIDFGVLQTSDKWATFTARVRSRPSGGEQSATVIVEFADPFIEGRPKTVTVVVDGQPYVNGVLQ